MNLRSIFAAILILFLLVPGCRSGGGRPIFRYRSGPIATLDPAAATDLASVREAAMAYQSPLRPERTSGRGVPRPWLLAKPLGVSEGGRRLELEFRPGVRFQASPLLGLRERELDGCDWVRSVLRHADPAVGSHWKAYVENRIVGLRAWGRTLAAQGISAYFSPPPGLRCNGRQATVLLRQPDSEFEDFLAHPASSVLPVEEILKQGWDIAERPVGSGNWVFSGSRRGRITWKSRSLAAPLQGIEVDTSPEGGWDWDRLRRGGLDLIELPREIQSSLVLPDGRLAPEWDDQGFQLQKIQRSDVVFIGFQMKDPVLGKSRGVRQALSRALQGARVGERVFGGRAIDAASAIPPGMAGYRAADPRIPRTGDLGPAQDQLGFAGYPQGRGLPEFRMGCLPHPVEQELCRLVVARWELLGVRVSVVTMEAQERRAAILSGSVHFWPVTWVADLPGPVTYLEVFDPATGIPEIPSPIGALEGYRRALARAGRASGSGRSAAVSEAAAILGREAPAAFLVHRLQYWLVRPGIRGLDWRDFAPADRDELRKLDSDSK